MLFYHVFAHGKKLPKAEKNTVNRESNTSILFTFYFFREVFFIYFLRSFNKPARHAPKRLYSQKNVILQQRDLRQPRKKNKTMIVRLRIPRRKTPDFRKRNRFSVRRSRAARSVHGYRNALRQCFGKRHDHVIFERRFRRFSRLFVFVTVKLYSAVVISCPQSIVRLSEELTLKSIIRAETCAMPPPVEEEKFFSQKKRRSPKREELRKRITSAKTDLAPFLPFCSFVS